jgi:hypothetical protein
MTYLLLIASILAIQADGKAEPTYQRPTGPAIDVLTLLEGASPTSSLEELRDAAAKGADLLIPQSPAATTLSGLAKSELGTDELRRSLIAVREDLAFEPLCEADLPAGFPTYTPPGVLEIKTYPKNRRAVANEFFPLFAHITRNKIAMTAPVRMEFKRDESGKLRQESMAFFYGDSQLGSVGADSEDENVSTIGDDGDTVIALGRRGRWNRETIVAGESILREWLKAHPEYKASGDVRLMGYNSPMTPTSRQFFEIQLPIEQVKRE